MSEKEELGFYLANSNLECVGSLRLRRAFHPPVGLWVPHVRLVVELASVTDLQYSNLAEFKVHRE